MLFAALIWLQKILYLFDIRLVSSFIEKIVHCICGAVLSIQKSRACLLDSVTYLSFIYIRLQQYHDIKQYLRAFRILRVNKLFGLEILGDCLDL